MAERKPFLLRLDPETFAALQAWAADDLRSVNGQVEFLLRHALRDAGRLREAGGEALMLAVVQPTQLADTVAETLPEPLDDDVELPVRRGVAVVLREGGAEVALLDRGVGHRRFERAEHVQGGGVLRLHGGLHVFGNAGGEVTHRRET